VLARCGIWRSHWPYVVLACGLVGGASRNEVCLLWRWYSTASTSAIELRIGCTSYWHGCKSRAAATHCAVGLWGVGGAGPVRQLALTLAIPHTGMAASPGWQPVTALLGCEGKGGAGPVWRLALTLTIRRAGMAASPGQRPVTALLGCGVIVGAGPVWHLALKLAIRSACMWAGGRRKP
jgi:hypothetical protein